MDSHVNANISDMDLQSEFLGYIEPIKSFSAPYIHNTSAARPNRPQTAPVKHEETRPRKQPMQQSVNFAPREKLKIMNRTSSNIKIQIYFYPFETPLPSSMQVKPTSSVPKRHINKETRKPGRRNSRRPTKTNLKPYWQSLTRSLCNLIPIPKQEPSTMSNIKYSDARITPAFIKESVINVQKTLPWVKQEPLIRYEQITPSCIKELVPCVIEAQPSATQELSTSYAQITPSCEKKPLPCVTEKTPCATQEPSTSYALITPPYLKEQGLHILNTSTYTAKEYSPCASGNAPCSKVESKHFPAKTIPRNKKMPEIRINTLQNIYYPNPEWLESIHKIEPNKLGNLMTLWNKTFGSVSKKSTTSL